MTRAAFYGTNPISSQWPRNVILTDTAAGTIGTSLDIEDHRDHRPGERFTQLDDERDSAHEPAEEVFVTLDKGFAGYPIQARILESR